MSNNNYRAGTPASGGGGNNKQSPPISTNTNNSQNDGAAKAEYWDDDYWRSQGLFDNSSNQILPSNLQNIIQHNGDNITYTEEEGNKKRKHLSPIRNNNNNAAPTNHIQKKVRIRFGDDNDNDEHLDSDDEHLDSGDDEEEYVDDEEGEEEPLPPPPSTATRITKTKQQQSSDLRSLAEKARYNTAFEIVLKRELYNLVPLSREYSHEVRTDWILNQRRLKKFGWASDCGISLYEKVVANPSIAALKHIAPKLSSMSRPDVWWSLRLSRILKLNCRSLTPLLSVKGRSVIEADEKGLGLRMLFEDYSDAMIFFSAMKEGKTVPGRYGNFTVESATPIAWEKTWRALLLLVVEVNRILAVMGEEPNVTVDDVLGGMTLDMFISTFSSEEGLAKLKGLAIARAEEMSQEVDFADERERVFIRRLAALIWVTSTHIVVYYNDIITCLVNRTAGVYPSKTYELHIFTKIKEVNKKDNCVGVTVQNGFGPSDFRRVYTTSGSYFLESFHDNSEDYPIIIDMDAGQSNLDIKDEDIRDEYRATIIPGSSDFARRVKVTPSSAIREMHTFEVKLRSSKGQSKPKSWSLHQLNNTVMSNMDLGFNKNKLVRSFLGLKEGEHFESVSWLAYGTDDLEYMKRRTQHLRKKDWEDVEFATCSDNDHSVGRSQVWMNTSLYTILCSHSWNRCQSYVRLFFGDWGYAFVRKQYVNGSD